MQEIAKHHGVKTENILLTAGSGEVLDVVGTTFLAGGKKYWASSRRSARLRARVEHQGRGDQVAAR